MTDLVNLGFKADTRGLSVAQRELDKTANAGARTDKATRSLGSAFSSLAVGVGAGVAALGTASKLLDVTRQFDVLNAQLITATGSAANAAAAFDGISKFAARTPYDLGQVTDSFTKLVNLGLTPSERALMSYGNTASAMGKSLNQFIEAVADATTNEFERLKEFGIKSKQEGENVSFTFRGASTTVKKEAAAIEGYLMALGENEFAGAMSNRMDTLDGKISNLGDSWDSLFLTVSNAGIGKLMEDGVDVALKSINELSNFIKSGQLDQSFEILSVKFSGYVKDIELGFRYITELFNTGVKIWGDDVNRFSEFMSGALLNMPENIRAAIQLTTVEIASLVDYGAAYGQAFAEILGVKLGQAVESAKVYGKALGIAMNPFSDESIDIEAELSRLTDITIEMSDKIFKDAEDKAELTAKIRRDSIVGIITERDAAIKSSNEQIKRFDELGKAYAKSKAQADKDSSDKLAQYKVQTDALANQKNDIKSLINDVDSFGGAWTRTGNIVVDAFGSMSDAIGDYSNRMVEISKLQEKIDKERAKGGADNAALDKLQMKLNDERVGAEIDGYQALASGAASMFSEKTAAAKAFNAINQVLAVAEIALSYQKISAGTAETAAHIANETTKQGANALTAITSAFAAPFPINFATGAAMIGIMASLLGGSFGSGGGGSYELPKEGGTGSVLGDSSAQSGSIGNSMDEFSDIQIDQLAELRGIRAALNGLNSGIERLASQFAMGLDFGDSGYGGQLGTISEKNLPSLLKKMPSFVDPILSFADDILGGIIGSFSSKKKKLVDSGISFMSQTLGAVLSSDDLAAEMYQVVETTKKKFWGLSKKTSTSTETSDIESSITQQMANIFGFIGESVLGAAESLLGESSDFSEKLAAFTIDIGDISFKDKTGDEIQAELEAIFSQQADLIAEYLVPSISEYQKVGEGAFETLQRVAYEQAVFNDALGNIGISLSDLSSLMQIEVSQAIISLIGGVEEFASLTNSYFENFYSESEQLSMLESSLTDVFDSLGLSLTTSKEQFRELVEGIDLTTAEGQSLFATLMELNPALADYIDALDDLANDKLNLEIELLEKQGKSQEALALKRQMELDATDESLHALLKMTWALDDAAAAEAERAREVEKAEQLLSRQKSLQVQLLNEQGESEKALALQREIELAGLDDSLKALMLQIYAQQDLNKEREAEKKALDELKATLESNVAFAEQQLEKARQAEINRLNLTIEAAKEAYDSQLESINLQREAYQNLISDLESAVSKAESGLNASLSAELSKYDDLIKSANDSANEQISAINSASSARLKALNAERGIVESVASQFGELSKTFTASEALRAARMGDFTKAGSIESQSFNTAESAMIGAAREAYAMAEIGKLADAQLSDLDRTIAATESSAQSQIDAINSARDDQVAELEAQRLAVEESVKAILGIDDTVLSLDEAMAQYQAAQDELQNAIAENTLEKLQSQEDIALAAYEQAKADAEDQIDAINQQVDALLDIDNSVLGLKEAMELLESERKALAEIDIEFQQQQVEAQQETTAAVEIAAIAIVDAVIGIGDTIGGMIDPTPIYDIWPEPPIDIWPTPPSNEVMSSGSELVNEIKALRKDMDNANAQIGENTKRTADSVRKLEYMQSVQ